MPIDELVPLAIRGAAQSCLFEAGAVLARQGQSPRHMYCVVAGEVRLQRNSRGGATVTLQRVRRGWVAEASLFMPRYHCDLIAGDGTTCVKVPVRAFADALENSAQFAREWVMTLSSEVRRLRNSCERLSLRNAHERVLHAIESDGHAGELQLSAPLKDWASELGITHEALYRTLARMEAQGLIERRDGWIRKMR